MPEPIEYRVVSMEDPYFPQDDTIRMITQQLSRQGSKGWILSDLFPCRGSLFGVFWREAPMPEPIDAGTKKAGLPDPAAQI